MQRIIGDWSTKVLMTSVEAKEVCKMGQGSDCCAFLIVGMEGFTCVRMAYPSNISIFSALEKSTTNAKGTGGWDGCEWEGELNEK